MRKGPYARLRASGLSHSQTERALEKSLSGKPLLFLDVDGVLFPENGFADTLEDVDQFFIKGVGTITVPFGTRDRVQALLEYFEPVWATAWLGKAHFAFAEYLELPAHSWPHIEYSTSKVLEIVKWANGRPWVWIDDDATLDLKYIGWSIDRHIADNALIIVPNRNLGLNDNHVRQAIDFARAH